jgi:hypothetical protein
MDIPQDSDMRYLTKKETAEKLKCCTRTVDRHSVDSPAEQTAEAARGVKTLLKYHAGSGRKVHYRLADVQDFFTTCQ